MKKIFTISTLALSVLGLAACVADNSTAPNVYQKNQLQHAQHTTFGTILSMKPIVIQNHNNTTSSLLTLAGGAIGAIGGSHIGGGTGAIVSSIVGGLAGGMATNAIANNTNVGKSTGVEFTVKLDSGRIVTFAQHGNIQQYYVNQRVKVVTDPYSGVSRIDNY